MFKANHIYTQLFAPFVSIIALLIKG